jgi:RimJ/RimL family protein N-acetyltransferase
MTTPYLVERKVRLRPLLESDATECWAWFNDPDVRRTLALRGRPNTEAISRAFIHNLDPRRDQVFAIMTREDDVYVGNCGLHEIHPVDRYAMLGLVIGRKDYWGKGLGTEAVRLLCRYAFDELNLHRVALSTYAINERGVRLYTRVGFKIEGRKREQAFIEGRYVDEVLMGLLRGEIVDE